MDLLWGIARPGLLMRDHFGPTLATVHVDSADCGHPRHCFPPTRTCASCVLKTTKAPEPRPGSTSAVCETKGHDQQRTTAATNQCAMYVMQNVYEPQKTKAWPQRCRSSGQSEVYCGCTRCVLTKLVKMY